jgi:hypothetical protein
VYRGKFGVQQAERLLWRAGFGPRPGEAEALAKLGLHGAVHSLLNPGLEHMVGPKPHDAKGRRPYRATPACLAPTAITTHTSGIAQRPKGR